jgi:hypothetical protein
MMTKPNYLAFFFIILINLIFAVRYLHEATSLYLPVSLAYVLIMTALVWYVYRKNWQFNRTWFWIITGFLSLVSLVILKMIPQESIMVDRWSVIKGFWNNALQGINPYQTHSHTGKVPGPFPVYFLLAFPFYLIGEIGFFSITGILLTLYFWQREKAKSEILLVLLLSVCIYWEIVTRSTVIINSMLFVVYFRWLFTIHKFTFKKVIVTGIVGGLLLSTRGIYLIPCIAMLPVLVLNKPLTLGKLFIFIICAALGFIATFLPLLFFDLSAWSAYNPFRVQSGTMAWWIMPLFTVTSFVCGFYINNFHKFCLVTGTLLFTAILFYLAGRVQYYGFSKGLFVRSDISRFLFAFPFLLFSINSFEEYIPKASFIKSRKHSIQELG